MSSKTLRSAVVVTAVVLAAALEATAGTAGVKTKPPCKAGVATSSACTRAWVAKGCAQFVPLIKATMGLSVTAEPSSGHKSPPGDLNCGYAVDGTANGLGFGFNPKGLTPASFTGIENTIGEGWAACQASSGSTAQTPIATPTTVPGLGSQGYVWDPCPGGVLADSYGDTTPNFVQGAVRTGVTDFSAVTHGVTISFQQMEAFLKELSVKYH